MTLFFFFFWGGFGFSYTKMGGKLERTYPLASTKSSQQLSALSGFLNQKSEPIPWGRKPPWLPWMSGCLWRVWLVVPMIRRWKFSGAPSRRLSAEPIPCPWCGELEAPTHPKQCKLRCLERNSWLKHFGSEFSLRGNEQEGGGLNTYQKRRGWNNDRDEHFLGGTPLWTSWCQWKGCDERSGVGGI